MKTILLLFVAFIFSNQLYAQLSATFTKTLNTNCLGQPCNYEGPTILINELMISPSSGDGSIIDDAANLATRRGEWIELYNPNLCEPVDVSCYYLGNYVASSPSGANGFRLPDNVIVPPGGFVLIRGINAPPVPSNLLIQNGGNTIEIVLPAFVWDDGVCSWGNRVWFPNVGGWFAFYDANGVAQDAVSWANSGGVASEPCVAESTLCPSVASLASYDAIPAERKNYTVTSTTLGSSIRRIPDGGSWSGAGAPTQGTCNTLPCATVGESTCTGTATVNVTGGQPPYTYLWDDSQLQMTQTAVGLCGTTYNVVVTDANGLSQTFSVDIENFVPTVTLNIADEFCVYDNGVSLTNFTPIAGANETSEITGPGVNNWSFNPGDAGDGTHTITYTFTDEFGCTNSAQDQIIVHPIPQITLNVTNEYCANDVPAQITQFTPPLNGTQGTGVLTGTGVTDGGLGTIFFSPTAAGPGVHTVTYTFTSIYGCVNSMTNDITVHGVPAVNITVANGYCAYDPQFEITATTTPPVSGAQGTGVISGPGVTTDGTSYFFNPSTAGPGTHTINYAYTTINGCLNSDTDQITVFSIPTIDLTANPTEGFTPANITFTGQINNANSFTWNFGEGTTVQNNLNQMVHSYTEAGTYTIILIGSGNGCLNSDTVQITLYDPIVYEFPNVFSPNGDQDNPFYNLINVSGFEKVDKFEFLILNRWGNVVQLFTDKYFTWDGKTNNGDDAAEGVYFYKLTMSSEFGDEYENHGYFHLIR